MGNNIVKPFFSVIMPAYNAAEYICEAIESVIRQTVSDWELIVINDGSTDATVGIAERYVLDKRVRILHQENKKLGAARNTGMAHATGNWICFLDADDYWLPDKLERQAHFIKGNPAADVVFSDGYTLDQSLNFRLPYHFPVAKGWYSGKDMYQLEFSGNCIPVLSACIKKDYCAQVGGQYEHQLQGAEDWDYWLRLAREGARFYGMEERLFVYRFHTGNMSSDALLQEAASALVRMNNFEAGLLDAAAIRSFKRYLAGLEHKFLKKGMAEEARLTAGFLGVHGPARSFRVDKNLQTVIRPAMKTIFLKIIEMTFFRPYRFYQKHAHNFTVQYYRWELGARLETRGSFFMSPKAALHITAAGAKFITYGIYINDFSQINMDRNNSYLLTGKNVNINRYCNITIWDGRLLMGNNVSLNNYCSVNCMQSIEIGDDTWFGEGVRLYDHNHKYKAPFIPFIQQGMVTGPIKIGNNCWIGSNTVILQNVTIGDNCVIGANNLIYKSVPANTIIKTRAMEFTSAIERK